jgi:hypothetical protein
VWSWAAVACVSAWAAAAAGQQPQPGPADTGKAGDAAATPDPSAGTPEKGASAATTATGAVVVPAGSGGAPRVHHSPVMSAPPREPIEIRATVEHPQRVRHLGLVYRTLAGEEHSVPFQRAVSGGYVAIIPGPDVQPPGVSYALELEGIEGGRTAVFASRREMQPVQVLEDRMDAKERMLFERLDGRRSVVTVSTDVVRFGQTSSDRAIPCAAGGEGCRPGESKVPIIDDQYWRVEAGYTYRPLRTVAEFSLRAGVVRGTSLVPLEEYDERKYEVGLNYGAPSVRFRLADAWHLETELLTSVTEVGFSVGTGGALLIGDPYGSRLTLGFETIGLTESTYFGSRIYTRMDIAATDRIIVAPVIEVTDMPHAQSFGVRLLAEASAALGGGLGVAVRGGYQARKSTSGGPGVGGNVSMAF